MLLMKVDPDLYTKFLSKEGGKDVIDMQLAKALYGMIQAAMLLFWKDLSGYLVSEGANLTRMTTALPTRPLMESSALSCGMLMI
jgi:hypothetical protein